MLLWYIFILIIGFYFLIKSGGWLIKSLIKISSLLSVSEFFASFILMSFASTLPEFLVGISSSLSGIPKLSLGNVFGSSITHLGLVLGITSLLSGRINFGKKMAKVDSWNSFLLGSFPLILFLDGTLSRFDGLILIALFFLYLYRLLKTQVLDHEKSFWASFNHKDSKGIKKINSLKKNLLLFFGSVIVLILSSYFIVESAKFIAQEIMISELIIGVILIAIGTSLPELVFGIRSSLARHPSLSLGNIIGATAFNSTWILGIVAVISPISLNPGLETIQFFFIVSSFLLFLFLVNIFIRTKGYIERKEGLILLILYFLFIISNLFLSGFFYG